MIIYKKMTHHSHSKHYFFRLKHSGREGIQAGLATYHEWPDGKTDPDAKTDILKTILQAALG